MADPIVAIVAGSDPLGYSGLQADLRHLAAMSAQGVAIPTCLTEQGENHLVRILPVPVDHVTGTLRLAQSEMAITAVKVGLVPSAALAKELAVSLRALGAPYVVDPICVSSGGASLLESGALEAIVGHLFPQASLITPNLPEMRRIAACLGRKPEEDPVATGSAIVQLGARAVLLKGGHGSSPREVEDILITASGVRRWVAPKEAGIPPRGTGCALSTAIAVALAAGTPLEAAVEGSILRVRSAIRRAMRASTRRLVL